MKITSDWHIHSHNSCDSACMPMSTLVARAAELGITDLGITDHVHTPHNLPDIAASREEFLGLAPSPRFHFGVEVSCVSQWEIDEIASGRSAPQTYGLREGGQPGCQLAIGVGHEDIARYGIEYVVAGTHWRMYVPLERDAIIRDYHRQNLFLASHPLVTIVAHPWWWMGYWQESDGWYRTDPWIDDFGKVPRSMHVEFADAVKRHGKVVEINLAAMLLNKKYPESFRLRYLDECIGFLHGEGVKLAVGSDCHNENYDIDFQAAGHLLDRVGIGTSHLWVMPPRTERKS